MLPALLPITAPVAQTTQATPDPAKARLKSALEATRLTFAESASGLSFTVRFDHEKGRQQTVYISIAPGTPGKLRTHTIYTTIWVGGETPPDGALLKKVLGQAKKLGAFYLFKDSKGLWALRFNTHFDVTDLKETLQPDDPAVKTLKDLIYFVNQVGEELDLQLNGPDKDIK